jgi:hypothetical protein
MKAGSLLGLPVSLLILLGSAHGINLPYNPTRIFLSPQNDRVAYVLRPVSASSAQCSLSSLDLSAQLTPSNLPYTSLFSWLPFLDDTVSVPLNAVIDGGGNITIYAGNCSAGGSTSLWRLNPQGRAMEVGSWTQQNLTQKGVDITQAGGLTGSNFLAASIAFSSNVSTTERDSKMYFFGGMCPLSTSTPDSWQSTANYSSSMLTYTPKAATNSILYNEAIAAVRTQPIAQAGHSITALEPTFSNRTDGSQTQQQDFVLLGGHTQTAFLNMSQVALFSLPQEAWTYFPVMQPSASGHTDLTVRDNSVSVDPRSGHTAVMSSDGKKIIVLGGWVGNINTPASPQLAVLNVGNGYGGQNDWSWTVPSSPSGSGLAANTGIYGHGAMMLPGNIMLVVGGYAISASSSSKSRRTSVTQMLNSKAYFYNITSNSWLSDYTAPASSTNAEASSSGPLATASQKAGLGAGLGIGSVAVVSLLVFYLWYKRRLREKREDREREIIAFSALANGYDEWGMPAGSDRTNAGLVAADLYSDREKAEQHTHQGPYPTERPGQPGWRGTSVQEAERTGLLVEIPSPTRGLRRNGSGRGSYPYERRGSRNMEHFYPIAERDEEDQPNAAAGASEMSENVDEAQTRASILLVNSRANDPFTDPRDPLGSHPVSVEGSPRTGRTAADREQELRGWVSEWERAAEELIAAPEMVPRPLHPTPSGRLSPSKSSERTSSTLSDQSSHSTALSYLSATGGVTGMARSLSTRSAAFLNSLTSTFSTVGNVSPTSDKLQHAETDARASLPSQLARQRRGNSLIATGGASQSLMRPATSTSAPKSDDDSFSSTLTSFAQLQAEGEALLGSYHPTLHVKNKSEPSSPIREKKGLSWVGSVKRVISGAYTGRSVSLTQASPRYNLPSPSSTARASGPSTPRRAASDAAFLKGRRGARDWYTDDPNETRPSISEMEPSHVVENDEADEEDDWDVERAAENRVVQLMFTVPKQRLRVVNADVDGRSLISFDEPETSEKGKGKVDSADEKEVSI